MRTRLLSSAGSFRGQPQAREARFGPTSEGETESDITDSDYGESLNGHTSLIRNA